MRADFKRKESRVAAKQCVVEKTIILPAEKYDYLHRICCRIMTLSIRIGR